MITKTDWQTIRHELLAVAEEPPGDPPTAEEMFAYTRGELASTDEARVRTLLVAYPALANALTAPFPQDDAMPGDACYLSPAELEERLAAVHRRIEAHGEGGNVVQFWRRASAAMAAALVLAVGGLLGQAQWDAQRLRAELAKPRVPSENLLLMPDGQRGRPVVPPALSPEGDSALLMAPLVGPRTFDSYRLALLDEKGGALWRSGPLYLRDDDTFAIFVPRAFLKSGKRTVVLYGVNGTQEDELATYSLTVP